MKRHGFPDGKPITIDFAGCDLGMGADNFNRHGVRLIEPVLPPGRAAAAVEKLQAASFNTGCSRTGYAIDEAIEILQPEVTP